MLKDNGRRVGVRLTSNIGTIGEAAIALVADDWIDIAPMLADGTLLREGGPRRFIIEDFFLTDINDPVNRAQAIEWLRSRIRDFVAVFRPRIRDAVAALKD